MKIDKIIVSVALFFFFYGIFSVEKLNIKNDELTVNRYDFWGMRKTNTIKVSLSSIQSVYVDLLVEMGGSKGGTPYIVKLKTQQGIIVLDSYRAIARKRAVKKMKRIENALYDEVFLSIGWPNISAWYVGAIFFVVWGGLRLRVFSVEAV